MPDLPYEVGTHPGGSLAALGSPIWLVVEVSTPLKNDGVSKKNMFQKPAIDSMKVIIFILVGESSTFRESFHCCPLQMAEHFGPPSLRRTMKKPCVFFFTQRPSYQTPGSKNHCWDGAGRAMLRLPTVFFAKLNDDIVTSGKWPLDFYIYITTIHMGMDLKMGDI